MKKFTLFLLAGSALAFTSCKEDPAASFSADKTEVQVGDVVKFTDNSTAAYNHVWDFGDGEWSTAINPTHVYYDEGTYNVTLQVTDDNGGTVSLSSPKAITVLDSVNAMIEGDQEEKNAVIVQMVGNWELDQITYSYNGNPTFENFSNTRGDFAADGDIFQQDEKGNKSIGYYNVYNSDFVYVSFIEGPSALYQIDELSETRMKLVYTYTDFNLPSNVSKTTLEFRR
jgi:hypothetical protein